MFPFIRNLVGVKTDQAVNSAMDAIVQWDPKAATEAELRTMEQHLDELGQQVAQARMAYEKEKKEADAIDDLSHQRMAAAESLQQRIASTTDPAGKASIEKSLGTLLDMLEKMSPDVAREKQDAADAADFLHSLEGAYQSAGDKLKGARDALTRAQRDMGRADQQRQMAESRAESARQAAGLTNATSGLNVALKAMQDNAARNLATAEAANAKAKLLAPTAPEKDDPNIAAAMAQVSGAGPTPTSLSDRLAALQSRLPRQIGGPAA